MDRFVTIADARPEAAGLDQLTALPGECSLANGAGALAMAVALAEASAGIARLDQALASHPLRQAFLYRARLDAVRRQAAVDGTARMARPSAVQRGLAHARGMAASNYGRQPRPLRPRRRSLAPHRLRRPPRLHPMASPQR
jgi:hypothetical protein